METSRAFYCAACGEVLEERDPPTPCRSCGSTSRRVELGFASTIEVHSSLDLKAKHSSSRKPFQEQRVGDSFFRKTGKWHRLRRLIDRRADRYVEHVEDETGETVRDVDERLTDHTGRGSARRKRRYDEDSTSAG